MDTKTLKAVIDQIPGREKTIDPTVLNQSDMFKNIRPDGRDIRGDTLKYCVEPEIISAGRIEPEKI